jgi:apolipoprotein N-acyltransferase
MEKKVQAKNTLLFAAPFLFSAIMLTVIQAPIGWWPLAWVSLVPFIIACSPKIKPKRLFLVTFIISFFYWLGNLYWIAPITIIGWITMCLYTALLWPILALSLQYCRMKKVPLFLASAVLVVGVERMQGLFLGGFFWRFLAHSQYENITIIQIADIFGAGGVSFLIAMVNGLLAELIIIFSNLKYKISDLFSIVNLLKVVIVFAAVTASIFYGRWRISQEAECIRPGPMVASLQSNVPQSVKRSFESSDVLFNDLMEQSNAAAAAGAELIVWPETMVQAYLDESVWPYLESPEEHINYDQKLKAHSKDTAYVLVGAYGAQMERNNGDYYLARYNSAFLYTPDGQKAREKYDKIHLVPFGEVLPFRKSIPSLYNLLMKFTPYNFDYSLDYGSNYTVFNMAGDPNREIPNYKFSVMICYEGTVPYIARGFALDKQGKKQIDWIINISNDGWFVRFKDDKVIPSTELPQHAAVCAFRAVENRLAVLRSVNTGISCLIDSFGRIRNGYSAGTLPSEAMARTGLSGWFLDRIPIDQRTSFFSKYGEWLDFCCEVFVFSLIILLLVTKFVRFKNKKVIVRSNQMKKRRKKVKTRTLKIFAFTIHTSFFLFLTLFACGCESFHADSTVLDSNKLTITQSEAIQIIGQSLADTDPLVRLNAIEVVATTRQLNFMPRVQQLLQDTSAPVRFASALAVGDMQYTPAKNLINRMLKDPDSNVIIAASYAMVRLGHPDYITVLRESISDTNQTVRANAAMLLGKSNDRGSLKLLYWALQDKKSDDKVTYQTAEAIAMLGDESIYPKLWAMLISAYADVRVIGIRAMGTLGTRKAEDALISMLDDEILEVRLAAAEQLGKLNNTKGEPIVIDVFRKNLINQIETEARDRVYVLSALAIGQIGTPTLTEYLPQLMKNESKFVRLAAAKAVFQSTIR